MAAHAIACGTGCSATLPSMLPQRWQQGLLPLAGPSGPAAGLRGKLLRWTEPCSAIPSAACWQAAHASPLQRRMLCVSRTWACKQRGVCKEAPDPQARAIMLNPRRCDARLRPPMVRGATSRTLWLARGPPGVGLAMLRVHRSTSFTAAM